MYYEGILTTMQQQVSTLNSEWIVEYRKLYPNDKLTQRYCEVIEIFGVGYVIKDEVTEPYITLYTAIVDKLPEKPIWHDETVDIQIVQSNDDCLSMLDEFPEIGMYRKENLIETIRENGLVYIYVNFILEDHYNLLMSFGCKFNVKEGCELYYDDIEKTYRSKLK